MKNIIAGFMGLMMVGMLAVDANAASRGVSSSRSSFSRPSVSAPKSNYTAPKMQAAPKAASTGTSSNPGLRALGFGKPASVQTAQRPSVVGSPKAVVAPVAKTTTTSGGWFSKKTVSSSPSTSYKAPVRRVSSPVAYRSSPQRNVTVIQRNYYGGSYYGHNYGYGGGYYRPHYVYGGYSNGFGSAFVGTFGGMMMYNALFNNHSSHTNSGATAAQIEQAKQDQRIEDKLDRVLDGQKDNQQNQTQGVMPMAVATAQPQIVAQPQCYMPEDAPLMMSPSFYCEQPK